MKQIVYILVFFFPLIAAGQNVEVRSEVNKKEIKVGEQFTWKLTATQDDRTKVSWPVFNDKVGEKLDIVKFNEPDTVFSDDKSKITFSQEYVLTGFDSGYASIPSVRFEYTSGNDTLYAWTDSIPVLVTTVPVDTTKGFYDISGPVDAPFNFRELLPYVIVIVAVVIVGLIIFFIVYRLARKKKNAPAPEVKEPEKPVIPAHIIARERFEALKEKRLWQNNRIKEYYSELTDVIREYLHNRYFIDASEMTTDEILSKVQLTDAGAEPQGKLGMLLRMADLVKFAKGKPSDTEHEDALVHAEQFVDYTKKEEITPKPDAEKE